MGATFWSANKILYRCCCNDVTSKWWYIHWSCVEKTKRTQALHSGYLGTFFVFFLIYICDAQRNLHKGNLWFFLLSNRVSNAMVQMKILRYLFAHENKYLRILDEIWYKAWTPSLHRQRSSSWLALFSHPLLSRREGLTGPRFTSLFQIHQPLWTCFFWKNHFEPYDGCANSPRRNVAKTSNSIFLRL